MQRGFNKVDHRFIRCFFARAGHFFARLLLFSAPHVNKDHQHARLDQLRINCQRLAKSHFRPFEVFSSTQALENPVDVRSAQTVMCQGKIRIELNGPLKVFDSGVAVFRARSCEK